MSKEQTPMEELLSIVREMVKRTSSPTAMSELKVVEILIRDIYSNKEKEHTQAKVLEALEREQEDLERMYLLGRYERGESDKKMDLIDTSKSVIDEILRNRSKTKL